MQVPGCRRTIPDRPQHRVNLFQPTEPSTCKVALHLLRGKAAEMANNISQQVIMVNLQELLTSLDRIFNTTGNRIVQ